MAAPGNKKPDRALQFILVLAVVLLVVTCLVLALVEGFFARPGLAASVASLLIPAAVVLLIAFALVTAAPTLRTMSVEFGDLVKLAFSKRERVRRRRAKKLAKAKPKPTRPKKDNGKNQ